jgi:hypothetical protein
MQRSPSPYRTGATAVEPWRKTLVTLPVSPDESRATLSPVTPVSPDAVRRAPAPFAEFAQPRPVAPLLLHGHAWDDPSPAQKDVIGGSSRWGTSRAWPTGSLPRS